MNFIPARRDWLRQCAVWSVAGGLPFAGRRTSFAVEPDMPPHDLAWQRPDGWNIAVLLNGRRDAKYREDLDALKQGVDEVVSG